MHRRLASPRDWRTLSVVITPRQPAVLHASSPRKCVATTSAFFPPNPSILAHTRNHPSVHHPKRASRHTCRVQPLHSSHRVHFEQLVPDHVLVARQLRQSEMVSSPCNQRRPLLALRLAPGPPSIAPCLAQQLAKAIVGIATAPPHHLARPSQNLLAQVPVPARRQQALHLLQRNPPYLATRQLH